jgi:uncharacterized protein
MWRDVTFASGGEQCCGWLYTPEQLPSSVKAPTIVMANAITAVKEMVLPGYAERFAAAGYVCLAFDFRYLGASGGHPRGQIFASEQIDDLRNAISWLSLQPEVDPNRIGAWGASFGGGHVLHLSAFDRRIKAAVATAPSMRASDTLELFMGRQGLMQILGFLGWERTNRYQSGAATTMKAVSDGSENAMLPNPEALEFYTRLARTVAPRWNNQVTIESLEKLIEYDPADLIELISPTPLLVVAGENDRTQPPNAVPQAFERAGEPKKLVTVACGHTDLLDKVEFVDRAAGAAIEWFKRYLG